MRYTILAAVSLSALITAGAAAQRPAEPCCAVVAVDLKGGTATGKDKATGRLFKFDLRDAKSRSLKVGQAIWADFAAGKVRMDPVEPCCNILQRDPAEPVGASAQPTGGVQKDPAEPVGQSVKPAEPCCAITAIDVATGRISARDTKTNRTFQFEVKDAALLKTLKVGQNVFADFGSSKVRIHGSEPCCNIIGHSVKE